MFAIAGGTGNVGAAAATDLLNRGEKVRAVVSSATKGQGWEQRGADAAVADLGDRSGLAEALRGCTGFFAMLPSDFTVADYDAHHRRMADEIAGAVEDSGVPHVAMLSSMGAELPEGTGPIRVLHYLENRLRETGAVLSAVRPGHFQEKVVDLLGGAREAGVYVNFGDSADVPVPMVATRDIGAVVAQALLSPPAAHEVIDVEGPAYTERQVAEKLGTALGTPLRVVDIPQPGWIDALTQAGLTRHGAEVLAELYDASQRGLFQPKGDRRVQGWTGIDDTLRALVRTHS